MLDNVVEICVAIDIAILGIAYPIIVDKISNIGEKFSSNYLPDMFEMEFPQRSIKIPIINRKLSYFKLSLYSTIISFLLIIFNCKPKFGWDNCFINNSADSIVFVLTITLCVLFFLWLDKVVLYNGKSTTILKYLIGQYDQDSKKSNSNPYFLKTINEFTFYAIEKQDYHLQETLLEFYYEVFSTTRNTNKEINPLIYPADLYHLVNRLNYELVNSNNRKLLAIEHRAVSGIWLLGEDFNEITISEDTYYWLWRNLLIICTTERFIRMYWSTVNQYFDFQLNALYQEYDDQGNFINEAEVERRIKERNQFLEFHYALGGLLLYKEQYKTLKYLFEYSQSLPPKYVLLPKNMTTIFILFEEFRNEFRNRKQPIDIKYPFPELDNLGNRRQVNYWICSYLALLFIRQYSLHEISSFRDYIALPILPEKVTELNNWLDSVSFFEKCLNDILDRKELLVDLNFLELTESKKDDFKDFIKSLNDKILEEIGSRKLNAELSEEKLNNFKDSTKEIITKAFESYNSIFRPIEEDEIDKDVRITVTGGQNLMTKSAFTEDDIPHMNYNSIFAQQITKSSIQKYIPNSFFLARTQRYLLDKSTIIKGIEKLIAGIPDFVVIGINISYEIAELINSEFPEKLILIPSSEYTFQNLFFILRRADLPSIEHKAISPEFVKENQLELIDEDIKLYASVIDINKETNEQVRKQWSDVEISENKDLKVQITIAFFSVILWKKNRKIVQINITSEYRELGVANTIEDIQPLKEKK